MIRGADQRHDIRTISRLRGGNNFESYSTGDIETEKEEREKKRKRTHFRSPVLGAGSRRISRDKGREWWGGDTGMLYESERENWGLRQSETRGGRERRRKNCNEHED